MPCRVGPTGSLVGRAGRDHTLAMQQPLTLVVNGESRSLAAPSTVAGLLATLGLDARKVAVERNEEIVPRSAYADVWLAQGDWIEIVHFIGGG